MKLKAFMVAIGCLIVFAAACLAEPTSVQQQAPSAFLPERTFTFPEVVEGTEIVHEFQIQNRGTGPLDILKVETS